MMVGAGGWWNGMHFREEVIPQPCRGDPRFGEVPIQQTRATSPEHKPPRAQRVPVRDLLALAPDQLG